MAAAHCCGSSGCWAGLVTRVCPILAQVCSMLWKLLPLCQRKQRERRLQFLLYLRIWFPLLPHGCFLGPAAVPTCRLSENMPAVLSSCAYIFSLLTGWEMHPNMDVTLPVTLQLLVMVLLLPLSHLPLSRSTSPHRGNCRPIRFEPPMLDFHEQ